jgi:hypothetical protein
MDVMIVDRCWQCLRIRGLITPVLRRLSAFVLLLDFFLRFLFHVPSSLLIELLVFRLQSRLAAAAFGTTTTSPTDSYYMMTPEQRRSSRRTCHERGISKEDIVANRDSRQFDIDLACRRRALLKAGVVI